VHVLDISSHNNPMAVPLLGHLAAEESEMANLGNAKPGKGEKDGNNTKKSEPNNHMDRETKQREMRAYEKVMGEKSDSNSDDNMLPFNIGALPGAIVGTVGAVVKTTTGIMGVTQKPDPAKVLDNSSDDDI
jgi:hypothetical protein